MMKTKLIKFKKLEQYVEFLEAIPEEKWCTGVYDNGCGQHCVLGHLGQRAFSGEIHSFRELLKIDSMDAAYINNGSGEMQNLGDTPKERVLNALALKINGLV